MASTEEEARGKRVEKEENHNEQQRYSLKLAARECAVAQQRGDAAFLEHTLTEDYVGIGPRGFMLTKEKWLARHVRRPEVRFPHR